MPNPNSLGLLVSEISAFIRTDVQTDMARSTRLVILSKSQHSRSYSFPDLSVHTEVSEITAFIRTDRRTDLSVHPDRQTDGQYRDLSVHPDGQTDHMGRSTRLVILIKNIYTLWKRLLLPVTYFPKNLVYPFFYE